MWCSNCFQDVEPVVTLVTPEESDSATIRQWRCPDCGNIIAKEPLT